ncbi:MAG TPA: glutamate synthase large subunit [Solirubrobacterales bacterium]
MAAGLQAAHGLYDPRFEHDGCGLGFVCRLDPDPSHEVVARGLAVLERMKHRGAEGADALSGDGSGMLLQIPDALYRATPGLDLPEPGAYGVAMCFLPRDPSQRRQLTALLAEIVTAEGQRVLGWRPVPVDLACAGAAALRSAPQVEQLFIGAAEDMADQDAFERKLYVIRRVFERQAGEAAAITSCSSRTVVYKGMLTATQLAGFYPELRDERTASQLALVHSRFSTNTFPSWAQAHPYRMLAHNGEINTLMGNRNWMRARESQLRSSLLGADLEKLMPVIPPGGSDSATLDAALELLAMAGRSIPHALMMLMPEAHAGRDDFCEETRGFYEYHSCLMEPWDGPAAVAFSDGRVVGALLDRNGLRPGRWTIGRDGWVVFASESGVLPLDPELVEQKGRLEPGRFFFVDLERCEVVEDGDVKRLAASRQPYGQWYREGVVRLDELPEAEPPSAARGEELRSRQLAFGYTQEDLRVLLEPMAVNGVEPVGSMGNDLALAAVSDREPLLFSYFKQLFAQVTNPPIDPLRERVVMSLASLVGGRGNLFEESPEHARRLLIEQPILRSEELERLRRVDRDGFRVETVDFTWPVAEGPAGMEAALRRVCREAAEHVRGDMGALVLSDRGLDEERAAIPSLLAVAAVHEHLVREGIRLRAGLLVESGEPREVHHMAALIGYGAAAVNPYLAFETLDELVERGHLPAEVGAEEAERKLVAALCKGLLKVISRMGISTIQSYRGAQIFEAVGLDRAVVDRYFTGTASRIGGVGLDVLAREALARHARGFAAPPELGLLPVGGVYQWRRQGERHIWNPATVAKLQQAVGLPGGRSGGGASGDRAETYAEYARLVNDEATRQSTLRGLLRFRRDREPIPLERVEPAAEIVKRFSSGAMSLGSISPESHEALAIAMNRIGAKSNTGEGGEDPRRYRDERRSAIKQVASGRFGVTVDYLVNADQLQIKIAQGAKPGEGGQLPGQKVSAEIAALRHSTPGVGLISPPPHHDIYSIEDLKQLIYDLRCANPEASVSVKLVSEVGVGTVAAGVAKANADHVTIAGHDGGTGASPQSSIQHVGVPWEIGLAETQQTLLRNGLRSRIAVQVDGQLKTGRDVVIGALLGADEFGFATAPLIAMGCIMMRVCHLNTCPVGIATQNPELRRRFQGAPEHVVNFLFFVAEEARRIMASLGIARFEELIGRSDLLETDTAVEHWKARRVDLSTLLAAPALPDGAVRRRLRAPEPGLAGAIGWQLIEGARPALEEGRPVRLRYPIQNVDRAIGGLLSGEIVRRHGAVGLPEGTIEVAFNGSAGQSFGAWLAPGVTLSLEGDANDYAGKGLSGGTIAIRPPRVAGYAAERNVIAGNTVLYGATSGRAFFSGLVGERFAVRNSGALAVVEGVGDHGCEYMTGGRVVVLGPTGRNFGAGMSGGIAYVLDERGDFGTRCNLELVGLEEVGGTDAEELRELVAEHVERTGSTLGERVLACWDELLPRFVKVMPSDYKRALEELAQQAELVSPEGESAPAARGKASMGEIGGFLRLHRVDFAKRDPAERIRDYAHYFETQPDPELQDQGARCMDCGVPFCHLGCPLGNLIPDWNDQVYRGRWREAIDQLHATNNFPEFTGRICPAPCESACVLAINDDAVTIQQLELGIVEHAFREGWVKPQPPAVRTRHSVAVVGAGPAGMAAAAELNKRGHSVTVFERDEGVGGLMRLGVPDSKLEKWVIDRRARVLEEEGIVFTCGVSVGRDLGVAELRERFGAIVIATGSRVQRGLDIPGSELAGVHPAMDYLYQRNRAVARAAETEPSRHAPEPEEEITAAGKRLVVIGGGDTGMDCLSNARREGALEVTILDTYQEISPDGRYPHTPWPLSAKRTPTTYALDEGGERRWGTQAISIEGADGRVARVDAVEVRGTSTSDAEPVAGTEFSLPADLVLVAIGFSHPEHAGLVEQLGVELDSRGNVKAAAYATSRDGVFAAGDARRGQSLIVWAIAEGRRCARAVDRWLTARPGPLPLGAELTGAPGDEGILPSR